MGRVRLFHPIIVYEYTPSLQPFCSSVAFEKTLDRSVVVIVRAYNSKVFLFSDEEEEKERRIYNIYIYKGRESYLFHRSDRISHFPPNAESPMKSSPSSSLYALYGARMRILMKKFNVNLKYSFGVLDNITMNSRYE